VNIIGDAYVDTNLYVRNVLHFVGSSAADTGNAFISGTGNDVFIGGAGNNTNLNLYNRIVFDDDYLGKANYIDGSGLGLVISGNSATNIAFAISDDSNTVVSYPLTLSQTGFNVGVSANFDNIAEFDSTVYIPQGLLYVGSDSANVAQIALRADSASANPAILMYKNDDVGADVQISYDPSTEALSVIAEKNLNLSAAAGGGTGHVQVYPYLKQQGIYAELHLHDNSTGQSIANGTTYAKITQFTDSMSSNMTASGANDYIIATIAGKYKINGSFSFTHDVNNITSYASIFKNSTEQDNVHYVDKIGTASDIDHAGLTGIVTCAAGDTLDLRVRHSHTSAVTVTFNYANINVEYLGD
jgi:hypothetical protein